MIKEFVKMLGIPLEAAEDALKSERMAKSILTRRGALLGTAALVAGTAFSFYIPVRYVWMAIDNWVSNLRPELLYGKEGGDEFLKGSG